MNLIKMRNDLYTMKHILYDTGYSGGKLRYFEEPKKGQICACGTQRQNSHVCLLLATCYLLCATCYLLLPTCNLLVDT